MRHLEPRLISIDEAARILGISPKTIRNRLGPKAANPFPIKPNRFGRRVLFDVRKVYAFIDEMPDGKDAEK